MSRGLMLTLMLGLGLASPTLWAAGSTLQSVHLKTHDTTTTIRFDLDTPPHYHSFSLDEPPRAVIDLDNTHADDIDDVSGGLVKSLRLARHDDRVRTVLDLRDGAHLADVAVDGHDLVATIHARSSTGATHSAADDAGSHKTSAHTAKTHDSTHTGDSDEPKALYRAANESGPVVVVIDPGHGGDRKSVV